MNLCNFIRIVKLTAMIELIILTLTGCQSKFFGMLSPQGIITHVERQLFFDTTALMLIVVLPVIIMSFTFVYHYQVAHRIKEYKPNWSHSTFLEILWWWIPCVIIIVLAILTWRKTHELDPYKPILSNQPPFFVQVIALPWKWLFIYPQQNIATINYLEIPVGQSVTFSITADNVPMSAFFIPQLSSQIYSMAGMRTQLNLLASQTGDFQGMSALYNGDGFSDMHFITHVASQQEMQQWISQVKKSAHPLTNLTYQNLLQPTIADNPQYFSMTPDNLFENVLLIYRNTFGTKHPREQYSMSNQ